jgi:hypothetical protein
MIGVDWRHVWYGVLIGAGAILCIATALAKLAA